MEIQSKTKQLNDENSLKSIQKQTFTTPSIQLWTKYVVPEVIPAGEKNQVKTCHKSN
jgi:hypothetical protein